MVTGTVNSSGLLTIYIVSCGFGCSQLEGETLKDFAERAQKQLDKENIPIKISV